MIYSAPLLFEIGFKPFEFNKIIVIFAPKNACLKRIIARDFCTMSEALLWYNSQIPIEYKIKYADIVTDNQGTVEELKTSIFR